MSQRPSTTGNVKGLANISPQEMLGTVCAPDMPPDVRRFIEQTPIVMAIINKAGNIINEFGWIDVTNATVHNLTSQTINVTDVYVTHVASTTINVVTIYDITNTTSITINSTTVTINNNLTVNGTFTYTNATTATVLTDFQYDSATNKFQKKTQTITVLAKDAESAWTDVFTATTKSVTVSVDYDTGTNVLSRTNATLTVLEAASNDSPTTVLTATNVTTVIDVDVSGTSLRKNTQVVAVLEAASASGLTSYHDGTECAES